LGSQGVQLTLGCCQLLGQLVSASGVLGSGVQPRLECAEFGQLSLGVLGAPCGSREIGGKLRDLGGRLGLA
jgi:hypothetical protein